MTETPIYQLGYFVPNMIIGDDLDMDKNRFTTIENQLYNIYNIFGNGVLAVFDENGAQIPSWILSAVPSAKTVQVSTGKGHVNYKYAETTTEINVDLALPGGATSGTFIYYFYAQENDETATLKSVDFIYSLTQLDEDPGYVGLGAAELIVNTDGSFTLNTYNTAEYGRQDISLYTSLTSLVKNHVHIGGPNNPAPIDLSAHVTGFLTSDNIDQLDLSKVTKGTLDPNRLPQIDHQSLINIGTLTHDQIDSLLASIQYPDNNYKLSDYGIVNRLQIILLLKKQTGFFNIDGEQLNTIFYLPYTQLEGFVDLDNTTALVNNEIHRVYGTTGLARQSNSIKINSTQDFNTALFYAQDSISSPTTTNIEVTGVTTTSAVGTINIPYGVSGSANTVYISSAQDSFVSSFSTNGSYINRRIDFDPNLNLNSPLGLYFDNSNNYLYIADTYNHRIIVSDPSFSSVIAKIGANNGSGVPGAGNGAGFNLPKAVYGMGNTFYVADSGNNQIQQYLWVSGVPYYQRSYQFSANTIRGINQSLNDPRGLYTTSVGSDNYFFVSDYNNHRVLCGILTNNAIEVFQVLGQNSAGLGISNTSLITFAPYSNVKGTGANFTFQINSNNMISSIGISNSGLNYSNNDSFTLNYIGQPNGYFKVKTDSGGFITTAFVEYGISTTANLGFNHPQGIAFSQTGSRLDLIICDTDNNRVINYTASVGLGSTQFTYGYSFGTSGTQGINSDNIYLNRPTNLLVQSGFTTMFVADSLNNRIHRLGTSFVSSSVTGFSTFTFGIADTSISSGGITLSKPLGYVGISTPSTAGSSVEGWFVGERITQGTQFQADSIERYSYTIFAPRIFSIQDTVAVAVATLNETTGASLGEIDCYLIFKDDFGGGTVIDFNLTNNANRNQIKISSLYPLRSSSSTEAEIFQFPSLTLFTDQPNPSIIGFGFKWSTATGWTNNEALQLGWYLPRFNSTLLQVNYPRVYSYRQSNGLNNSIFAFNANKFAGTGTFVFRFDAGVAGNATFDNVIYNYITPYSPKGTSNIRFYYRVADTLDQLNITSWTINPINPVSGGSYDLNKTGRFIDLIFVLNAASVDSLAAPVISSIALNYSVFGNSTGIIYDTNVNNAPQGVYPRLKWSQGQSFNLNILPINNDSNQNYEISIKDTSKIGKNIYLSSNNLVFASGAVSENFVDVNNDLYISPYQAFAGLETGLLNPQYYYPTQNSGYFIADTDNDRVIEVDSEGQFIRAIQGNIKLTRTDRAFAILGAFYNTNTKQIYLTFSQYIVFGPSYLEKLSVFVNGLTYQLANPAYFDQVNYGLFNVNINNQSATFYINVTNSMDAILVQNPNIARFQIQNPATDAPFQVPVGTRSDNLDPEDYTISYSTDPKNEFITDNRYGVGTIINSSGSFVVSYPDPVNFGNAGPETAELWSYWQGINQIPNYSNFYSIPIQVKLIYFDNIFKPIHLDYTDAEVLVVSTVGNNAIRAYDSDFIPGYKISLDKFTFNEKLGGSTVVLDRGVDEPGNVLLVSQPGLTTTDIEGKVLIYNRNSASLINQFSYVGFDAVQAYPQDNDFVILLNDRLSSLRSKLLKIGQDGTTKYSVTNQFSRPVSLDVSEDDNYYVTDLTGQYGTIFFRTFVEDGAGTSSGQTTGSGGSATGGGNFGGQIPGGGGGTGGTGTGTGTGGTGTGGTGTGGGGGGGVTVG